MGAALLGACGGGGSTTAATADSSATVTAPKTYAYVKPTQGDTITYTQVNTPSGLASSTFTVSGYWKAVNADGSSVYTNTISATNYVGNTTTYDTTDAEVSYANLNNGGNVCTYAPGIRGATPPYSVGQTWSNTSVETCLSNSVTTIYDVTNAGSITALEAVTEGSASFNALKAVYTVTAKNRTSGATNKTDTTCWRDTVLGQNVKCSIAYSTIASGSTTAVATATSTLDLVRYNAAGIAGSVADPAVYAGGWTVSFAGSYSGSCTAVTVLLSGAVSGSCTNNLGATFAISGTVSAQGSSSFTQGTAAGNATFTGQLTPVSGSGIWGTSTGAAGTWTITHK